MILKGRSSNQMEIDANLCNQGPHNHSHLSNAYIHSLVKHLTSSRTTQNPKNTSLFGEEMNLDNNHHRQQQHALLQHQQQHKKQVRKRLHTTRPYQERLVNMAEARREIVTALKFHRAAMKQQAEQKHQQQQQQQPRQQQDISPLQAPPQFQHDFGEFPNFRSVNCPESYLSFTYQPSLAHLNWPVSPISPLPAADILNFVLPNQPLGLNLNLQDFDNINTSLYHNCDLPSSLYLTDSSPSSSSSNANPQSDSGSFSDGGTGKDQMAMDDEEMVEMRSIGGRHQMEWNDNMNLATSAWWFNFLKEMDVRPEVVETDDGGGYQPFGQAVELEFPAWLNSADNCSQQHFDDCCLSQDYFQDTALPCMEIGEIEAIDEEWLY